MKLQYSAGGIVYKFVRQAQGKTEFQILVGKHSGHHGWVFPKGLIGDHVENENKEETAIREVKEETGIEAKIEKKLIPVKYRYVWKGETINKTVYYFIMKYVSGDTKDHDWEMEVVEWIPMSEVENRLTYESDKKVWKETKALIR